MDLPLAPEPFVVSLATDAEPPSNSEPARSEEIIEPVPPTLRSG